MTTVNLNLTLENLNSTLEKLKENNNEGIYRIRFQLIKWKNYIENEKSEVNFEYDLHKLDFKYWLMFFNELKELKYE